MVFDSRFSKVIGDYVLVAQFNGYSIWICFTKYKYTTGIMDVKFDDQITTKV